MEAQDSSSKVDQAIEDDNLSRYYFSSPKRARFVACRYGYLIPALIFFSFSNSAVAINKRISTQALADLSLEELTDIEVTSVSKSSEKLRSAAAAIAVVTSQDIHRSGATTVPEALRFVPGLTVARQNSDTWAVSARGFSSVNSEKVLVLSDTRSIYTPLFSGVLWDVQDYLIQDIERIEVIRGPGAALWGSNAVNGVINITTKKAQDTQGTYAEATLGSEERASAAVRYGGTSAGGVSYRVFGKYADRDSSWSKNESSDDWRFGHFGVRTDWDSTPEDSFTVQGDIYRGTIGRLAPSISVIGRQGPTGALDVEVSGGNLLGRWKHIIDPQSNFVFRAYYDNTHRNDPSYLDDLNTLDLDFQHQFMLSARQEFLWGLNYHLTANRNVGKGIFNVQPESSRDQLFSGFVQDQIALVDTVNLTLGSKYEHNDFSGYELQPSARLAWDFTPTQTLWTAVSRAVRVPTRLERDIAVDASDPLGNPIVRLVGNPKFEAEVLKAYEIGYRWQARKNLAVDVAAFRNQYSGLASLELGDIYVDPADGRTVIPVVNKNANDGNTQGVELLINFAPLQNWRLTTNYSYLDMQIDPTGLDLNRGRFLAGATPRHQFGLRSQLDLPANFQVDVQYRYQSAIRHIPDIVNGDGIGGYSEMDMRLAKRLNSKLEVSLVGQNLLHSHHTEFGAPTARGEIERGVYAKLAFGF
jgi:iron complex outermembrane receptor protein